MCPLAAPGRQSHTGQGGSHTRLPTLLFSLFELNIRLVPTLDKCNASSVFNLVGMGAGNCLDNRIALDRDLCSGPGAGRWEVKVTLGHEEQQPESTWERGTALDTRVGGTGK